MVTVVGRDPAVVKLVTCGKCASILEYTNSEVQTRNNGKDISGGADGFDYVACPNCGHKVVLRSW